MLCSLILPLTDGLRADECFATPAVFGYTFPPSHLKKFPAQTVADMSVAWQDEGTCPRAHASIDVKLWKGESFQWSGDCRVSGKDQYICGSGPDGQARLRFDGTYLWVTWAVPVTMRSPDARNRFIVLKPSTDDDNFRLDRMKMGP